jgi:hypothetical protein
MGAREYGLAAPVELANSTSSGVVLINESTVTKRNLVAALAHELFHVLEFAHSIPAARSWFGEASATWAEHIYAPKSGSRSGHFRLFQTTSLPLTTYDGSHEYGAAAWLVWLQQESAGVPSGSGGESAVFRIWHELELSPAGDVEGVINAHFPWSTDFRKFAVEDLNRRLASAVPVVFSDTDPLFQLNVTPSWARAPWSALLGQEPVTVTVDPLEAKYFWIKSVNNRVHSLRIDLNSNLAKSNIDVTVLAEVGGAWENLSLKGDATATFCREVTGQRVTQLYIVVDNNAFVPDSRVEGTYFVTGGPKC